MFAVQCCSLPLCLLLVLLILLILLFLWTVLQSTTNYEQPSYIQIIVLLPHQSAREFVYSSSFLFPVMKIIKTILIVKSNGLTSSSSSVSCQPLLQIYSSAFTKAFLQLVHKPIMLRLLSCCRNYVFLSSQLGFPYTPFPYRSTCFKLLSLSVFYISINIFLATHIHLFPRHVEK